MRLPDFIHSIRARIIGNAVDPLTPPLLDARFNDVSDPYQWSFDHKEYVAKVQLGMHMTALPNQEKYVREHVSAQLIRLIYDPVVRELIEVHDELRRAGIRPDNPSLKRIEQMIETLEPGSPNHGKPAHRSR